MTTRAQLQDILAEVLDLDPTDISIVTASDDGDVKIAITGYFLDDVDAADEDDEVDEDEDDTDDDAVEEDANDVSVEE